MQVIFRGLEKRRGAAARTPDPLSGAKVIVIYCAILTGIVSALVLLHADRQIRIANMLIPIATLCLLGVVLFRRRRLSRLTERRLNEAADAVARSTALSEAIEAKYLAGGRGQGLANGHNAKNTASLSDNQAPTIH